MKKTLPHLQYSRLLATYRKLKIRFDKAMIENRFKDFTARKQRQILTKLEKLRARLRNLEQMLKLSGAALAAGAMLTCGEVKAQVPVPSGSEFQVNTYTTSSQQAPFVAMDSDGDFVVVWESTGQDGSSAYYLGIYAQRYNASGVPQGNEFLVNTWTTSNQNISSIAMDSDGDFVIVWQSFGQDGDGSGSTNIYAQRYDASGVPQGSEFRVNTYTTYSQISPSVAMDSDGDFVVTWGSGGGQDGDGNGIYAQRYDALGVLQGSEFQVNTYTTGSQQEPFVAMDSDGDFVITWKSPDQDGSGIYAQRYNAAGVAQGVEFQVNSYTTNVQNRPMIAMDSDGDFVVTWCSVGQDGNGYGIYARRYDASGVSQGSEFQVNTYTTGMQYGPSIAMDDDGDFVITWLSDIQDGSNWGIYAQRYAADGTAQGSEFLVNTYTTGYQDSPFVAMDSNGDFVIAWQSFGQDGSYAGIYAQRYTVHAPVISDQSFSIDENSTNGTSVGIVAASDPDAGQTLSYAITAGNTGNAFAINSGTGEITVAGVLDFEIIPSYSLTVEVTDDGTPALSNSATITISVNDVTETGVVSAYANDHIRVYPNPSAGELVITSDVLSLEDYRLSIFNVMGETVFEDNYTESVSLYHLPKGVYMLKLEGDQKVMVKQVVIR